MYCSSKGEVSATGANPAGEPLEMASAGERAVDPSPRLTCRTTPELERNHIPAWWRERQAQWRQMREAKKQARDDEAEGAAGGAPKRPARGVM